MPCTGATRRQWRDLYWRCLAYRLSAARHLLEFRMPYRGPRLQCSSPYVLLTACPGVNDKIPRWALGVMLFLSSSDLSRGADLDPSKLPPPTQGAVDFERDIKPILD